MNTAFEVFQRTLQHGLSNCEGQNNLEYSIAFLPIEKTGRKPCSIRHSKNKYVM